MEGGLQLTRRGQLGEDGWRPGREGPPLGYSPGEMSRRQVAPGRPCEGTRQRGRSVGHNVREKLDCSQCGM